MSTKLTERQINATRATKLINQFTHEGRKSVINVMVVLKQVRDQQLWKEEKYVSFEQYISQPDWSYQPATVEKYISLIENLHFQKKIELKDLYGVAIGKLDLIKKFSNAKALLAKAKSLSYTDLKEALIELVTKKPIDEEKKKAIDAYSNGEADTCPCFFLDGNKSKCKAGINVEKWIAAIAMKKMKDKQKEASEASPAGAVPKPATKPDIKHDAKAEGGKAVPVPPTSRPMAKGFPRPKGGKK